jgi:hypothetical protein
MAMRPLREKGRVIEKFIKTSVGSGRGSHPRNLCSTKMAKVAEFQPDMVKIGFSSRMLQIYRSKRTGPESRTWHPS